MRERRSCGLELQTARLPFAGGEKINVHNNSSTVVIILHNVIMFCTSVVSDAKSSASADGRMKRKGDEFGYDPLS